MLAKQNNTHVPQKTQQTRLYQIQQVFFHCICGNSPHTTMPQINSHSSNIASHNRTTANNPVIIQIQSKRAQSFCRKGNPTPSSKLRFDKKGVIPLTYKTIL